MKTKDEKMKPKVYFPGIEGSYAHSVCINAYPNFDASACSSPEAAVSSFSKSIDESILVLPIENSIGGKVADIHEMLPLLGEFFIFDEQYFSIHHCLLGHKDANLADIKVVRSHVQALKQCSRFCEIHNFETVESSNTAVAAQIVSEGNVISEAAIASDQSAKHFNLKVLYRDIQNYTDENFTRFFAIRKSGSYRQAPNDSVRYLTCLYYSTRHVSSALFKSLLGFSTNGVNVVKLESFLRRPKASDVAFYVEIEGHPQHEKIRDSLEELRHYCNEVKIMGVIERHF